MDYNRQMAERQDWATRFGGGGDRMPVMEQESQPPQAVSQGMLYPTQYTWFIFVSAMDIMMTWIVLYSGGREVNRVAEVILHRFDLAGLVIFKFAMVILIILICEAVGRRRPAAGRKLATAAIAVTCFPVILSFFLLHVIR